MRRGPYRSHSHGAAREPAPPSTRTSRSTGRRLQSRRLPGIDIKSAQHDKLERLCRYVSRPPVATERLALTASGQVRYTLKTPYRDGTTHIVLEPVDFIARLAALVPPPRTHLTRYHGVFGIEIDTCQRCGGPLRIVASIEQPAVIAKILAHRERTAPPPKQPEVPLGARAPPVPSRLR